MEGKKTLKKLNNSHEKPSTIVAKEIDYFILKKIYLIIFKKFLFYLFKVFKLFI